MTDRRDDHRPPLEYSEAEYDYWNWYSYPQYGPYYPQHSAMMSPGSRRPDVSSHHDAASNLDDVDRGESGTNNEDENTNAALSSQKVDYFSVLGPRASRHGVVCIN